MTNELYHKLKALSQSSLLQNDSATLLQFAAKAIEDGDFAAMAMLPLL